MARLRSSLTRVMKIEGASNRTLSNREDDVRASKVDPAVLCCLLLVVATLLVYLPVRDFPFVNFDDNLYVTENPHIHDGLSVDSIRWSFTGATEVTNYWAPLTWLSILLDYEIYGMNAGGYHLTNLFLHIANTVLLFLLLRTMTGTVWRGGCVALLFAIHPLHVESVAWVSERKDVLSALFWMLTLWSYARYTRKPRLSRYAVVLICFMLGLMSKPMLVTLPFVLLLLDYWPLGRTRLHASDDGRGQAARYAAGHLILEKVPLFILALIVSVAAYVTQHQGQTVATLDSIPVIVRLENTLVAYVEYLLKTLWPHRLAAIYPHPGSQPLWKTVGSLVLLAGITAWCIRYRRRVQYGIVGWLWYLGTLVPVIGLVVIGPHAIADRYTYIPLIGIFTILVWGLGEATVSRHSRRLVYGAATVLIPALMFTAWVQVQYWRDSGSLFRHALDVTLPNCLAHNNLGAVYHDNGLPDQAIHHLTRALQIKPDYGDAHNNLGVVLYEQGRPDEAAHHFREALKTNPDNPKAHNNLGLILYDRGDLARAVAAFRHALSIDSRYGRAHNHLAIALYRQGMIKEAFAHFSEALRSDPSYPEAHYNLGIALYGRGDSKAAVRHFTEALRLRPGYGDALVNLRYALSHAASGPGDRQSDRR